MANQVRLRRKPLLGVVVAAPCAGLLPLSGVTILSLRLTSASCTAGYLVDAAEEYLAALTPGLATGLTSSLFYNSTAQHAMPLYLSMLTNITVAAGGVGEVTICMHAIPYALSKSIG